ncbi:MAG: PTS sugar transporter subunit IIA [Elusimicrobiota bacterium]
MAWFQKKPPEPSAELVKNSPPPKAVKGLKISSLLSEATILFPQEGQDKSSVLQALVASVCAKSGTFDWAPLLKKVEEREQGISTTLDTGLSLPHARVDGLAAIQAGMAVLRKPISDPKQPDLSIRIMFLFFSPNKQEAFALHLQLLRGVASLFQPAFIDQLTATSGPAAALELVRKLEA